MGKKLYFRPYDNQIAVLVHQVVHQYRSGDNEENIIKILNEYKNIINLENVFFDYLCGLTCILGESHIQVNKISKLYELFKLSQRSI